MSIVRLESIPQTWDDERDTSFFTIVAHLFSAEFAYGAGVLLASNSNLDESAAPVTLLARPARDTVSAWLPARSSASRS